MRKVDITKQLYEHYQRAGEEPPVLEKTYLSSNVLAKMLWQRRANEILKRITPLVKKSDSVADIGCGAGWYLKAPR